MLAAQKTGTSVDDRYGNRWQQNPSGFLATFNGNNNRIDGYTYDAAGNLLSDGTNHYTYDAENRLSSYSNTAGAAASYVYDALGQRVEKTSNTPNECSASGTVFYIRDLSGHVAVYTVSGVNQCHDEIFAGGRHLVTYEGRATFNHSDWLGTERLRIVSASVSLPKYDEPYTSYPFGDALTGNLAPPYGGVLHFTGQPHDLESNLEYFGARYDSSNMGRFMSPDPLYLELHRLIDPQQLNLYSYVRNNPLSLTDPTGLDITCTGDRCKDYLAALQRDVSFKLKYDDKGKVVADVGKDQKLSKSDKAFLKAIGDTKHHVTINAIDGGKDSSVFFGRSDGNHTGSHTIAFDQVGLLDSSRNAGGMTSAGLVGHETLEGYEESQGRGLEFSHNWANGLGFPGLDQGKIIGLYGDAQTGIAYGFTQQFQVHGTSTTENIRINFVTPIPAASVHSGMKAAGYPVSVEKPN